MARGLGLRTVAECVEDQATLRLLHILGVDYGQGWHVGHPGEIDLSDSATRVMNLADRGGELRDGELRGGENRGGELRGGEIQGGQLRGGSRRR
jgi:predicted signal transduction protein with EAL and GGDEF domain